MFRIITISFFATVLIGSCSSPTTEYADLIVFNATIWTANPDNPSAQAFAIKGDKILAIGTDEEMKKYKTDNTEMLNASGKFITPGFIDSHVHLLGGGNGLSSVQLGGVTTKEEFINRIKAYAKTIEPGTWIIHGRWDHTLWGGELPNKSWIDSVSPNHPVFVSRLDGHMGLANSKALELAGLDKKTADIEGGFIGRNEDGSLAGIFKDNAVELIVEAIPKWSDATKKRSLEAAMTYLNSNGVTSVHDMSAKPKFYFNYAQENEMTVRVYGMIPLDQWEKLNQLMAEYGKGNKWVTIGGLKGFADGSLGAHTAAFIEPYDDKPEDTGLLVNSSKDLYNWVKSADSSGIQVIIHAIGDKAIHTVLNVFEQVATENGEKDRRFRIEHSQHIAPADMKRYHEQDVIASVQPYHAIDDGRWAESLIGSERIKTTHAYHSLLQNGATMVFGSDWPVAPATPVEGVYAAVTRRTLDNKNPKGWVPDEKVTVEEALTAYTRLAAFASFQEHLKGTLEAGKLADFVILNEDLREINPVQIRDAKVLKTYVGGNLVYELKD